MEKGVLEILRGTDVNSRVDVAKDLEHWSPEGRAYVERLQDAASKVVSLLASEKLTVGEGDAVLKVAIKFIHNSPVASAIPRDVSDS